MIRLATASTRTVASDDAVRSSSAVALSFNRLMPAVPKLHFTTNRCSTSGPTESTVQSSVSPDSESRAFSIPERYLVPAGIDSERLMFRAGALPVLRMWMT